MESLEREFYTLTNLLKGSEFNEYTQGAIWGWIKGHCVPKPRDKSELLINLTEQYVKATQAGINEINKALKL